MTTITSSSTTAEVVSLYPVSATTDDLASWNEITLPDTFAAALVTQGLDTSTITVGLFGFDLTDFLADCDIADACDYDTYSTNYDGWAIGSYWALGDTIADAWNGYYLALCLDDYSCFGIYPWTSDANSDGTDDTLNSQPYVYTSTVAIAAAAPQATVALDTYWT